MADEAVPDEILDDVFTPEGFKDFASAPRRVTGDEGTVEERSIDEVRKGVQFQDGAVAAKKPAHGMYISKLSHGPTY